MAFQIHRLLFLHLTSWLQLMPQPAMTFLMCRSLLQNRGQPFLRLMSRSLIANQFPSHRLRFFVPMSSL